MITSSTQPRRTMIQRALAAGAWALFACSSPTSTPPTTSGPNDAAVLDPSELIVRLSPAEQATFCDWAAQQYGGYGHTVVCDAGSRAGNSSTAGADQAMCVMGVQHLAAIRPACPATIGDVMACTQWEIQNPCLDTAAGPAGCQVLGSAACAQ